MKENTIYSIQELVPLVAELSAKYTGMESTSVTYEKAQQLMEAVLYCIHELEADDGQQLKMRGVNLSAREAYQLGYEKVIEKVKNMKAIYHELIKDFQYYGVECLRDTILEGIPGFLKWYDPIYNPQDTILTLDYPILDDLTGRYGIDIVYEYVKRVQLEQKFLQSFPKNYVEKILSAYCADYKLMVENISGIVLQNDYFNHEIGNIASGLAHPPFLYYT